MTAASLVLTFGSIVAIQAYSYRHVYHAVQRQQTKWLVFSLAVVIPLLLLLGVARRIRRLAHHS